MKKIIRKYRFFILVVLVNLIIMILSPDMGKKSVIFSGKNFINFLFMLTPIFICIGLLDVWIERETMIKIMGNKSGIQGILVSFLLGAVTAVPLYALLPVAGMLLKKGSKISNVLIFLCSCTSIRVPLLLFEASSFGWKFTITSFVVNIFVVIIIAFLIEKLLTDKDKNSIYNNATNNFE